MVLAVAMSAAAMTATEAIKQRQRAMEGVRDGMITLSAIAKKQQPFDAELVQAAAAKVAEHLERAADLFPADSNQGDVETWAKPEVWSQREQFDATMVSAHKAAVDLQSVTDAETFPSALGKLGNGCQTCHDLFRLPKK